MTPEEEPLQVFGPQASEAIRELFSDRGIALRTGAYPGAVVDGALRLIPDGVVEADRVDRARAPEGRTARRDSPDCRRVHSGRRPRPRPRCRRRLRRRRHHELHGQARRDRDTAGGCGGRGDRRGGGRRHRAGAVPAGASRRAPHRNASALPAPGAGVRARTSIPWRASIPSGGHRRRSSAATSRRFSRPSPEPRRRARFPATSRARSRSSMFSIRRRSPSSTRARLLLTQRERRRASRRRGNDCVLRHGRARGHARRSGRPLARRRRASCGRQRVRPDRGNPHSRPICCEQRPRERIPPRPAYASG